jgi:corrinoid protein of di/trimethylamine methyltransferase
MPERDEIIGRMRDSITNADDAEAVASAEAALAAGLDPLEALEEGFAKPIRELGEAFDRMEIYLPQLVLSAGSLQAGLKVLEPAIRAGGSTAARKGVVVIGTVEGDIHDIGKTIVVAMLRSSGYEVHDLGTDVPLPQILNVAEQVKADIIGLSALLSTTMLRQRDMIEFMRLKGVRDKYYVIVGGAPVTEVWARQIGADAFARDASGAVKALDARRRLEPLPGTTEGAAHA